MCGVFGVDPVLMLSDYFDKGVKAMMTSKCKNYLIPLIIAFLVFPLVAFAAGNIDPDNDGSQYAWGENVGWINFEPSQGEGVTVTNSAVTGKAWGENIGWINLSPATGGVVNDGNGNLSGYAWGENVEWINFGPTNAGVKIDPATGAFNGKAWGENIGWINFAPNGAPIKTSWRGSPLAPSSLMVRPISSTSIVLSWKDNSSNEDGFKIYRKKGACDSAYSWSQITTKEANATSYTNTGLTPDTTYSYRVRAYNAVGNSAYSNCASAKTALSGTPKAPTNLKATSTSASQIKLTWKDNSTDETSFKIYRKEGTSSWSLLATKGKNIVSHTDTGASGNTASTTYSYYVKACNMEGCSPSTTWATVPYKPTTLTANASSSSRINLTWTDKSSNETGFQIERKNGSCSSTNSWVKIKTVGQDIESYGNTGLASGKTYSYRIRAYKKSSAAPYAYGYSLYTGCQSSTTP
jgi:hypothetical protein